MSRLTPYNCACISAGGSQVLALKTRRKKKTPSTSTVQLRPQAHKLDYYLLNCTLKSWFWLSRSKVVPENMMPVLLIPIHTLHLAPAWWCKKFKECAFQGCSKIDFSSPTTRFGIPDFWLLCIKTPFFSYLLLLREASRSTRHQGSEIPTQREAVWSPLPPH